jgi:hypothetical protein
VLRVIVTRGEQVVGGLTGLGGEIGGGPSAGNRVVVADDAGVMRPAANGLEIAAHHCSRVPVKGATDACTSHAVKMDAHDNPPPKKELSVGVAEGFHHDPPERCYAIKYIKS